MNKRVETLGKDYENTYDFIVSRATFKINEFLKKACPYVKGDGRLVLSKGPKISEEIKELRNQDVIKEILRLPLCIKGIPAPQGYYRAERNLFILQCKK